MGENARPCDVTVQLLMQFLLTMSHHLFFHIRFPNPEIHPTVVSLLEFFEIIYKLRSIGESKEPKSMSNEQMFFIPSLLSHFDSNTVHPSLEYYTSIESKFVLILHF